RVVRTLAARSHTHDPLKSGRAPLPDARLFAPFRPFAPLLFPPRSTQMRVIRQDDLIESVAAALQFISYYHPRDFIEHLARAWHTEQSPAARDAIEQILTNSRMCAEGHRPICQDTGIVNVFLKVGMDARFEGFTGSIVDAVNEGVRRGYLDPSNTLRASVVADPHFERK